MNLWLTMLVAGLVTYATRLSLILLIAQMEIPPLLRRALRFVPLAVLSAIVFPELLLPAGNLDLSYGNDRLIAGILATLAAWRTKNVLLTLISGMAALLILQAIR